MKVTTVAARNSGWKFVYLRSVTILKRQLFGHSIFNSGLCQCMIFACIKLLYPRHRRDFPHPSTPAFGPSSLLYSGYRAFPGGKAAGLSRWPTTPSNAEVKRKSRTEPLLLLWAFMTCSKVEFKFVFYPSATFETT